MAPLSFAMCRCDDAQVIARLLAIVALMAGVAISGCGSDSDEETVPGGADPDDVEVIKEWTDELRAGDVLAASQRFAIPSVVQNGTPPIRLTDRREVEAFNRSLPCGAKLTEAVESGRYTIATFELTERPGPGECGDGVGATAKTAFVIEDGLIAEWRRVVDLPGSQPTGTGPVI
jgi:hypothetical protein